jgi:hypothetical protein
MRIGEGADAPAAQVIAVSVENQHGWLFALKDIDPVLRIRGDRTGIPERLA